MMTSFLAAAPRQQTGQAAGAFPGTAERTYLRMTSLAFPAFAIAGQMTSARLHGAAAGRGAGEATMSETKTLAGVAGSGTGSEPNRNRSRGFRARKGGYGRSSGAEGHAARWAVPPWEF